MPLLQTLIGNTNLNPVTSAKQAVSQGNVGAAKVSANTPSPTSLGVQAKAPTPTPTKTTLPKTQVASPYPLYKGGLASNQVNIGTTKSPNIQTNTPATPVTAPTSSSTGTLPSNTTVDTNTQSQNTPQENNQTSPFTTAVGGLAGANLANKAITDQTQKEVNDTAANIAQLRSNAAGMEGGYTTGLNGPRAQGLSQVVSQTEAAQEGALQSQLQNQLTAGGQALTGQAQTQAAEQTAGSLTAPQAGAAFFGSPVTGGLVGQGSNTMQNAVNNAIQLIKNGSSQSDAIATSGLSNFGLVGSNALSNALLGTNSGYNPTVQSAAANATASNVGTAGTSGTQTSAQGYAQSLPAYVSSNTAFSTASQNANTLISDLNSTGINSSNSTDWNNTINGLAGKLGSSQTAKVTAALAEAKQGYTNLLASVGAATPTVNGQQATDIFNPGSTPEQISQAVDALNVAAYQKLAPQYQQALSYYNNLHGTNATEIPGNPPPTPPKAISTGAPQGPDTSAKNVFNELAGGIVSAGGKFLSSGIGEAIVGYLTGGLLK